MSLSLFYSCCRVGDSAGKEYQIESSLNKMESQWSGAGDADGKGKPMEFDIQPYKKTLTFVVRNVDESDTHATRHAMCTALERRTALALIGRAGSEC